VATLNAYSARVLGLESAVRPALTLVTCTEPLPRGTLRAIGLEPPMPFYSVDLPYLWGRVLPGDRLLIGGGLAFDPGGDVERIQVDGGEAREVFERLERRARGLHPALKSVAIERRWGGPVAFREERAPVLTRWPENDRLLVTGAYAGHGIALTVRIAELLTQAILDDTPLPSWGAL
jgi:glycine/D-amino acid oxidase-like deaminating enzyme